MKIFNLQSKVSLGLWSILLGLVLDFISIRLTMTHYPAPAPGMYAGVFDHLFDYYQGFPIRFLTHPINDSWSWVIPAQGGQFLLFLIDLVFWILLAFVILLLVKHFKKS